MKFMESDDEGGKKKDDESDESDEESDDDGKSRKRGRGAKSGVKGFNAAEIRRFIRSFRKFARPLER